MALREDSKASINPNNGESASQVAVFQANSDVLVHAEEAQKKSNHTNSSSNNTLIIKNSKINVHQPTNSLQNNIGERKLISPTSIKTTKRLKSVIAKVASPKKDFEISTSKRASHKSFSSKPSEVKKTFDLVVNENSDTEHTSTSTDFRKDCKKTYKSITSYCNKNTSPFKKTSHISEDKNDNKSIFNIKAKDIPREAREFKDKCNEFLYKFGESKQQVRSKSKSKKETSNHESTSNSKLERRSSSQDNKRSTSNCYKTSSKDINVQKYKSFKASFDSNKSHKVDLGKSNIKSDVVKGNSPSRTLFKRGDNVFEVVCKSEQRTFVKSAVSSSSEIEINTSPEQTKRVVKFSRKTETKASEQIENINITEFGQKGSHGNLSERFSKNRFKKLKITPNTSKNEETESDSEDRLKLPSNIISNPNSVKYATIKLVINLRHEQPTTPNETSNDLSENEEDKSNNFSNTDLSFLDDFNVDEIINTLDDCKNISELSESGVVIAISDDEESLASTLSLHSVKNTDGDIYENIWDNSDTSDDPFRLVPNNVFLIKR